MKHGRNIGKDPLKEEAQAKQAEKIALQEQYLDEWSSTDIGYGLSDMYVDNPAKARNVATLLENEKNHLERLSEAIVSQNFQTTPENVLKIVRIGTANSCRGEIFTEVPLSTVDDAIYFVDMQYESALRDVAAANTYIYEAISSDYAAEQTYQDTDASATTQFTITLSSTPVIPNSVVILLDGVYIGSDRGSSGTTGTITPVTPYSGAALTTSPTSSYQAITYSSGSLKLEFNAALTTSNVIRVIYNWDSENSGNFASMGTLNLSISKKRFEARPRPLGYNYSQMTEVTLGTTTGLDAEALLVGAIGDEHAKSKDYSAIRIADAIARKNQTYTFDTDFAANGELSYKSRAQMLLTKIEQISGDLYNSEKRGRINKAIVGSNMLTYMKLHNTWKDDMSMTRFGMYKAGTLSDIDVYVAPADTTSAALLGFNTSDALLVYKNPDEGFDISLAFGVLTELSASLTYPQMYKQGFIASVEDFLPINDKFVIKMSLTNFTV